MSPEDPRHGTRAGYSAHRAIGEPACAACKQGAARAVAQRQAALILGKPTSYPPHGVQRRIQALIAIGWTCRDIAARTGLSQNHVQALEVKPRALLYPRTYTAVAEVFAKLCMTPAPPSYGATRARARAARRGYAPPLAWDDIDDPADQPQGFHNHKGRPPTPSPAICGTDSGYYRHLRTLNESACAACRGAHREYERRRKDRGSAA